MSNIITLDSKIKEVFASPVGHDLLCKIMLQMGKSEYLINNPFVGNMKLKALKTLFGKKLGDSFFDTFLKLVNSEKDMPSKGEETITEKWWKEAVFYQIYPRSFCDSNGDGIGDIQGIISKLDYLKDLGIDALWLSPIYDSPNDDNGYDIRDYRKILKEYGTMEDFDELLNKAHEKGIRIIMDLVVNHTSDEHEWFKNALEDENSKYRDYYFLKEGNGENPPNNWTSFFSGSAWNKYEEKNLYGLHLFSKKQMDLNWENEELRKDIIDMINFWLDKGVDGFRMDVINYISKAEGLPDGDPLIGELVGFTGIEHYMYGPKLHEYLREIREKAFDPHNAFSVGETPGLGMEMAKLVTGEERKELDMVFSFDHLENPGKNRFDIYNYDLNYFRKYMLKWMFKYGNNCWMSLFYNNHDNPRMVSKIDPSHKHRKQIQKLLAVMQLTLKGTPFIFQGDEMGLTNYDFKSMEDIDDVESKNLYKELISQGKTEKEAFDIILAGTRDHARQPLPWNNMENRPDYLIQEADEEIKEVYKMLIALRKKEKALVYGDFRVDNKLVNRFTYMRSLGDTCIIVECNISERFQRSYDLKNELLYSSKNTGESMTPYEVRIYKEIKRK